jgi:acyl-CoA thioesterase FadM
VLPNDIDINGHMNNGRYMTIVDLMLGMRRISIGLRGMGMREEMLGVNHKSGYMPAL